MNLNTSLHRLLFFVLIVMLSSKAYTKSELCVKFCKCQRTSVMCTEPNTISTMPLLQLESSRSKISKIVIENQNNFTTLTEHMLQPYENLKELIIKHTSLSNVSANLLYNLTKIKYIDFSHNKISKLSWKTFKSKEYHDGLNTLSLANNLFKCGCDMKWIQLTLQKAGNVFASSGTLRCFDERKNALIHIKDLQVDNCEIPTVVVEPSSVHGSVGDSFELTCKASGYKRPKLRWNRDEMKSNFSIAYINKSDDSSQQRTISTLTVDGVTGADNGRISCIAENLVGQSEVRINVQIKSPPIIMEFKAKETFHLCITYIVLGYPTPKRRWLFNDQPLELTPNIQDVERSDSPARVYGCLELRYPTQAEIGTYTLIAENENGSVNKSVKLEIEKVPNVKPPSISRYLPYPGKKEDLRKLENSVEDEENSEGSSNLLLIIAVSCASIIVFFAMLIGMIIYCKMKSRKRLEQVNTIRISGGHNATSAPLLRGNSFINSSKLIKNSAYTSTKLNGSVNHNLRHISHEKVNFIRALGEGAFGKVFLATVDYLTPVDPTTMVAVKTLKDNDYEDVRKEFYREAELIANLQHDNIVILFGVSDDSGSPMMIFEYMEYGDLNSFLRNQSPDNEYLSSEVSNGQPKLNSDDLMIIVEHIAAGMEYLASQHFVHRDLATRNCLVGENFKVKIGDFGMSRDVYSVDYYRVGSHTMLPVRWMPPECLLYRKFTTESDIWSFGVVIWEIFEFGKQPWFELSNHEVIQEVTSGHLLPKPENCPDLVYKLMKDCWQKVPSQRSKMEEIYSRLKRLRSNQLDYLELIP